MALSDGTRLGPYEILSALGAGGMGEVYRARDTGLDRNVAIKILPQAFVADTERVARFQREAKVLASLNHPHIAAIYGLDEADGVRALVMELVEGEDLAQRLTRGPIPIDEALPIANQIAEALEAAHEAGIIHRDLKPANIKLRPDGTVKVLDFGLAKALKPTSAIGIDMTASPTITTPAMTRIGVILGTAPYMSPEQARGKAVDTRTDIWAFGCVLYEMLAGRTPFAGETLPDTLAAILEREPDWRLLPEATPSAIQRLLQHCLEKDSRHRLRDIGDARIDIDDVRSLGSRSAATDGTLALRHNLPAELTSFVGRGKELTELARVLGSSRLLSLTGAGGAGKTRLALRLASDLVKEFPDGVWFVDLAPISTPELVSQTIASAVGIREAPQQSMRDAVLKNLRHRELLLVLDNCEHLVDACAELAEALLRRAPAIRIVATSREALGVPGETVWRVASLSLPDGVTFVHADALFDSEATRLFIERAISLDTAFKATPENAATIARICARLDGIPLAIELAAARIVALSVEQIDTRLEDRFRLLTGGTRTAVARQRTLEATMQWSYQLLSDVERQLLSRLSVFPAGWTLEAAEQVCGGDGIDAAEMLDLVSRLVSKSLVGLESHSVGERRYRLLETVRQYARERLIETGAADRLRDKHHAFFFNEFRGALPILQSSGQVRCLKRLRLERDNVRAALDWAIASAPLAATALELAGALFWYWAKRGEFAEGRQWLERALTVNARAPGSLRARALIGLGHMLYFQGHVAEAGEVSAEALSLGREDGDAWVISFALFAQGLVAVDQGDLEQAAARSLEARDAANSSGESVRHAGPLMNLAAIALSNGDPDRALLLYDESIEVNRRAGDIWGLGIALSIAAVVRVIREDFASAREMASEAISLNEALEDPRGIAWSLEVFAGLLAEGHADAAARLWGASDRLLESVGGSLHPIVKGIRDRYMESVRTSLGRDSFETASTEGRAMSSVQAIALARQHALLLH